MSPYLDDLQAAGGRNSHTAEILVLYYSRTGATAELALPVCRGVLFGNFCILHVWNEKPELARNVEVAPDWVRPLPSVFTATHSLS
jgi:hypothetical protein